MIVFDNTESVVAVLKKTYGEFDVVMIHVEYLSRPDQARIDYPGLDVALGQIQFGRPIVLFGFDSSDESNRLTNDPRFKELLGRKNIAYIKFPWEKGLPEEVFKQISA